MVTIDVTCIITDISLMYVIFFQGEIVARGSFTDIRRSGIDLVSMCPLKTQEEEDEMADIVKSVKHNDATPRRRLSIVSTQSSRLQDLLHDQIKSHRVTEILEDNEGEAGALQVPVFVSFSLKNVVTLKDLRRFG